MSRDLLLKLISEIKTWGNSLPIEKRIELVMILNECLRQLYENEKLVESVHFHITWQKNAGIPIAKA